jgi:hypothetical protein
MDGKDEYWQHFIEDYGGQSNTGMYIIYKHILTESAFTEDLKIIWIFIIHSDFISH